MKVLDKHTNNLAVVLFSLLLITTFTAEFLGLNLIYLTVLTFIYSLLMIIAEKLKFRRIKSLESFLLLIMLSYIPITMLWTDSPNYGMEKLYLFFPLFIISFILAPVIIKQFDFFKLSYLVIFLLIICILLVNGALNRIVLTLTTGTRFYLDEEAVNSSVTIGHFFGFSILILSSSFAITSNRIIRLGILFLITVSIVFLFFTGARGPLVALIGAPIIYFLFLVKRKTFIYVIVLGLLALFLSNLDKSILYNIAPRSMHYFLDLRYTSDAALGSVNERFFLYQSAVDGIFSGSVLEFLFGHGIGDFSDLMYGIDKRLYPHNLFLEIGYEFGIIFLIGFILMNLKIFIINRQKKMNGSYKWLLIFYYFFLLRSMFSGDIAGNFLVFTFIPMIFFYESSTKIKAVYATKN